MLNFHRVQVEHFASFAWLHWQLEIELRIITVPELIASGALEIKYFVILSLSGDDGQRATP